MPRKTLRSLTCPANPVARRTRSLASDVAISGPEIALGRGSDYDAVSHLPDRVFLFQFAKHLIHGPALALARLSKASTNARHCI